MTGFFRECRQGYLGFGGGGCGLGGGGLGGV